MATVMVVEDDLALLGAVESLLTLEGYGVTLAGTGEAALKLLENEKLPDVVISDVVMPGISGTELFNIMNAHPAWSKIPFIFMSAITQEEIRSDIIAAREVPLLRKPFEIDDLYMLVDTAIAGEKVVAGHA